MARRLQPLVLTGEQAWVRRAICNPLLADRALHAEVDIGLLLPCNVIVYEREAGASTVAAMAPLAAMALVDNPEVLEVAKAADAKLRSALTSLEQDVGAAER